MTPIDNRGTEGEDHDGWSREVTLVGEIYLLAEDYGLCPRKVQEKETRDCYRRRKKEDL